MPISLFTQQYKNMILKFLSFKFLALGFFLCLIQTLIPLQPIKAELSEILVSTSHIETLYKTIDQIYQRGLAGNICKESLQDLYQQWLSERINLKEGEEFQRVPLYKRDTIAEYGERITVLALNNKPELINELYKQILDGTIDKGILPFFLNEVLKRNDDLPIDGIYCCEYRESTVQVLHLSPTKTLMICISYGMYNESVDFILLEKIENTYKLSEYVPPDEKYRWLHMYNIAVDANKNEFQIWPRPISYVNGDGEVWKITNENVYLIALNPIYGYLPVNQDQEKTKLTPTEYLIYYKDKQLRRLDRMLNFVYKKAYIISPSKNLLKKQQRAWLKARPNTAEALKKVYKKRIWELLDNDVLLASFCNAILSGLFQEGDYFYDESRGYVDYQGERLGIIAHALYKKYYGSNSLPTFDFDAYHYSSMIKTSDNKVFIFWATKSAIQEGNIALHFVCMTLERKAKGVFSVKLVPFPGQPLVSEIKPDGSTPGGYWGGLEASGAYLTLKKRPAYLWPGVREKWLFDTKKQKWIRQQIEYKAHPLFSSKPGLVEPYG